MLASIKYVFDPGIDVNKSATWTIICWYDAWGCAAKVFTHENTWVIANTNISFIISKYSIHFRWNSLRWSITFLLTMTNPSQLTEQVNQLRYFVKLTRISYINTDQKHDFGVNFGVILQVTTLPECDENYRGVQTLCTCWGWGEAIQIMSGPSCSNRSQQNIKGSSIRRDQWMR